MKRHVAFDELFQFDHRSALLRDPQLQARDVLLAGVLGGHARRARFEEHARRLQVLQHVRLRAQQVHRAARDLRNQPLGGRHDDTRALSMRDLDDPGTLQRLQRLADRRASDAVDFHQLALGGKLRARRDFARANAVHQTVEDFLVKLPALNDLSHGVVCANDNGLMTLPRDSRSLKARTGHLDCQEISVPARTEPKNDASPICPPFSTISSPSRRGRSTTPGTGATPAPGRRPR